MALVNWDRPKNSKIVGFIRKRYYNLVIKHLLLNKEIIKCHSGYAFYYIDPYGKTKPCSIRKESFGNLKENDYDLNKIIRTKKACEIRFLIKKQKCFCNETGADYLNILCNYRILSKK